VALATVALGAVAAVVAFDRSDSRNDATAGARVEACIRSVNPPRCLRDDFATAAARGDVAATLVALEASARSGDIDDCHLLAHTLARAVYATVGDVRRTFLLGGPQCRLGYLHGAVEASGAAPVAGAQPTHGVALPPCDRFARGEERGACAHGFGHALMLRTRHDIRASLAGCVAAAKRGLAREPCELGVMMENSLRYARNRRFARLSRRGCRGIAGSRRLARLCDEHIGVVAALSNGHDPVRAAAACDRLRVAQSRSNCRRGATTEIGEARREGSARG
jgi:hypothetical protein